MLTQSQVTLWVTLLSAVFLFGCSGCGNSDGTQDSGTGTDSGTDSGADTDTGECVPVGQWEDLEEIDWHDLYNRLWVAPSGQAYFSKSNGGGLTTFDGEAWGPLEIPQWVATEVLDAYPRSAGVWGHDDDDMLISVPGRFGLHAMVQKDVDDWSIVWSFTKLSSVWVAEDATAYAAGVPRLLYYDGLEWSRVEDPVLVPWLIDVWGSAPDDIYVSGIDELWGQDAAVFHFDGVAWTEITDEVLSQSINGYKEVHFWGSGPDDVFAADSVMWIYHFDGTDWETWDVGHGFYAIWGSGPQDVYAVGGHIVWVSGDEEDIPVDYPSIWHYDGVGWAEVDGEWQDDPGDKFGSVWGSGPDDVYAITDLGQAYHFDGVSFYPIDLGGATSVWGSSQNNVYAVGNAGTALHFDGASWTEANSGTNDDLTAIYGNSSGEFVAVGYSGTATHSSTGGWTEMLHNHCRTPNAFGATMDAYYIVCSNPGWIIRWDGSDWEEFQVEGAWIGVWGTVDGAVYAAGYEKSDDGTRRGLLGHFDGTQWTVLQPDVEADLNYSLGGVWADETGKVVAVGAVAGDPATSGLIVEYDGKDWTVETGFESALRAVWGTSADDVYAIGYDGLIVHFDGDAWTVREECIDAELYAIHGSDATNVYMMGDINNYAHIFALVDVDY